MKRGDVVIVALPGDLGKPRPALIVQSGLFTETSGVILLPITSTILASMLRFTVEPSASNGLRELSQVMTDRIIAANRSKVGQVIGALDRQQMQEVSIRLALLLGLT